MLFNSYLFVLFFLPATVAGYYLFHHFRFHSFSKAYLIGMSLWFYGYFNLNYLAIILVSVCLNYLANRILQKTSSEVIRKGTFLLAVFANIGALFYFKYYDFFVQNINQAFQVDFSLKHLLLPLGISFFTFQQLSYIIDSYRREVPDYHFLDYALFVTFFPQLVAGPIVTHDEIVPQFSNPEKQKIHFDHLSKGVMAFAFGLAKKVLVADTFGNAVNWGYANIDALDSTNAIFIVLAYTMQIYFDFSGYCDMATGIGLLFNIEIPVNFSSPYKALTIPEFWKRWHITLTRFFTKYVYIPLGGSQKGKPRTYLNVLIVFFLSGLWHGANWTFILWGVLHGIASVVSRIFKQQIDRVHPALNWLVTFSFVNLTWIYFRAPTIHIAHTIITAIFKMNFGPLRNEITACFNLIEFQALLDVLDWGLLKSYPAFFLLAFLLFSIFAVLGMKNTNERIRDFRASIPMGLITVFLLVWCILSFSGVSTFLYFNF